MNAIDAVKFILAEPSLRLKTIVYAVGLFALLGIPTALLSNPIIPYIRMIPATPLDYFFLAATSILAAVYLALPANRCNADKTAAGGGALGFLSFACPTCIHLLVLLVGFDFAFNVINPIRPAIGVIAVAALLYAIGKKWKGANGMKKSADDFFSGWKSDVHFASRRKMHQTSSEASLDADRIYNYKNQQEK